VTSTDVVIGRNAARLGTVNEAPEGMTVGSLARAASAAFGVVARVWGDAERPIARIATSTGSAGSLAAAALAQGADALVAGEVRYHDALSAAEAGLAVIELGHDVSEWPLVGLLAGVVRSVPGLDGSMVHVLPPTPGWWTT
jgi:putative NIF3 family GTP cyclohydrolase 1 type 2